MRRRDEIASGVAYGICKVLLWTVLVLVIFLCLNEWVLTKL